MKYDLFTAINPAGSKSNIRLITFNVEFDRAHITKNDFFKITKLNKQVLLIIN